MPVLLSALLVIASVALAYVANPFVPIVLICVAGPLTAFLLNRSSLGQEG
jgi:hypothetical protein